MTSASAAASKIRIIISDVDGVWTDGRIIYLGDTREIKQFHVRDGLAVKLAQRGGIDVAVITSRTSKALERRCRELGITHLAQGAGSKLDEMQRLLRNLNLPADRACYIGDDLPDLAPIRVAGLSAAPSDAAPEVLAAVTWKLATPGGAGTIRELVERLLRERGEWDTVVQGFDRGAFETPAT
ncbi:MAG TPA: HAD family hydrolase [Thermoanaerobaculia bacterium]|nr:HAD family hydrolase [Thermoanaerobaculia bacterium]